MKKTNLFALILTLSLLALVGTHYGLAQLTKKNSKDTTTAEQAKATAPIQVPGPEKKYVLQLTAQEITLLSQVIDASSAPHVTVMGITKVINDQLMPQVQAAAPAPAPTPAPAPEHNAASAKEKK